MIVVWGAVLATGVLLASAPWLWPSSDGMSSASRAGGARRLLDAAGFAHAPTGRIWAISAGTASLAAALGWLVTALPVVALLAAGVGAAAPPGGCDPGREASAARGERCGPTCAICWSPRCGRECR